jgi:transcriptional regulator with XRE-family HTH domain
MIMAEKKNRNLVAEALAKFGEANQRKVHNKLIIATKINRRLRELKITQKEFAEKIGKSAPEVSDILSGDRNLTIDTMTDIEHALDIHLLDTTLLNICKLEEECNENVVLSRCLHTYKSVSQSVKICNGDNYAKCV